MEKVTVDAETGCWVFRGATTNGYGVIGLGARQDGVRQCHRVTYEHRHGAIPDGLHIDHLCRNRLCCNPDHLEAVTQAENNLRAARANRRTHCKHGHEFTAENTGWQRRGRRCLICNRASARRSHHRKKAA